MSSPLEKFNKIMKYLITHYFNKLMIRYYMTKAKMLNKVVYTWQILRSLLWSNF